MLRNYRIIFIIITKNIFIKILVKKIFIDIFYKKILRIFKIKLLFLPHSKTKQRINMSKKSLHATYLILVCKMFMAASKECFTDVSYTVSSCTKYSDWSDSDEHEMSFPSFLLFDENVENPVLNFINQVNKMVNNAERIINI